MNKKIIISGVILTIMLMSINAVAFQGTPPKNITQNGMTIKPIDKIENTLPDDKPSIPIYIHKTMHLTDCDDIQYLDSFDDIEHPIINDPQPQGIPLFSLFWTAGIYHTDQQNPDLYLSGCRLFLLARSPLLVERVDSILEGEITFTFLDGSTQTSHLKYHIWWLLWDWETNLISFTKYDLIDTWQPTFESIHFDIVWTENGRFIHHYNYTVDLEV